MEEIFIQKHLFQKKEFQIQEFGLLVKEISLFKKSEVFCAYENIGTDSIHIKYNKRGWLYASIISLLLALILFISRVMGGKIGENAELMYIFVGIILGVVFIFQTENIVYLSMHGKYAIGFFYNNPSNQKLALFMKCVIENRNKFLVQNYAQINLQVPYETILNNLNWLRQKQAITMSEYEDMLKYLNNTFTPEKRNIGF